MATRPKDILKKLLVKRYNPETNEQFYQKYELRFWDEYTVLDGLIDIKDREDGTLTMRYSCRMGICGSCGALVNGKPVLLCQTDLSQYGDEVKIEPLRNFPVIKDLVVEIDDAMEKMSSVRPYMEPDEKRELSDGEYLQSPKQRETIDQTSQCIKCMLCYSACPVYGFDKKFIGPAAGALAYRYQKDSRDGKKSKRERADRLIAKDGVWKCSFVGECSTACPKRVDPALALQKLKLDGALHIMKKPLTKNM